MSWDTGRELRIMSNSKQSGTRDWQGFHWKSSKKSHAQNFQADGLKQKQS